MTVRIPTLSLAHTKTASIVDYMKEVTDEIEESGAEDGSALKAAFEAYRDSCRKKTSLYGATTREIDQNADHFWRGTRSQLKLSATHPEEETRTAALEILETFDQTPDPTRLKYQEQYGALEILLPKLEAIGEQKLSAAFVWGWIKALRGAYEAFREMSANKTQAAIDTELGRTQRLRDELLALYADFVEHLNAKNLLTPTPEREELARRINALIARFRLSAKAGGKKKNDEEEPI